MLDEKTFQFVDKHGARKRGQVRESASYLRHVKTTAGGKFNKTRLALALEK
jgi:predicted GTPase